MNSVPGCLIKAQWLPGLSVYDGCDARDKTPHFNASMVSSIGLRILCRVSFDYCCQNEYYGRIARFPQTSI